MPSFETAETLTEEAASEEQPIAPEEHESTEAIKKALFEKIKSIVSERHSKEEYHNEGHPEGVWQRASTVVRLAKESGVEVSEEEALATEIAARIHGSKVYYFVAKSGFQKGQRVRLRGIGERNFQDKWPEENKLKIIPGSEHGNEVEVATHTEYEALRASNESLPAWDDVLEIVGNEEASWLEAEAFMNEFDPEHVVFTDRVHAMVKEAIFATYPETPYPNPFEPVAAEYTIIRDPQTGEEEDISDVLMFPLGSPAMLAFNQPTLGSESSLPAYAVATGDLSAGGQEEFEKSDEEGDSEMREVYEEVRLQLESEAVEELSAERKAEIAALGLKWIWTQPGFLLKQMKRSEANLPTYNERFSQAMQKQYSRFPAGIIAAARRARHHSGEAVFEELPDNKKKFAGFDGGEYSYLTHKESYPEGDKKLRELLLDMEFTLKEALVVA